MVKGNGTKQKKMSIEILQLRVREQVFYVQSLKIKQATD